MKKKDYIYQKQRIVPIPTFFTDTNRHDNTFIVCDV